MKSDFKDFRSKILKEKLKEHSILCIYNTKTAENFIHNMQYYDKFDCSCFKISNIITRKSLENSNYTNYIALFSGLIMLAEFPLRNSVDMIKNIKELNKESVLLGININNKIYILDKELIKNSFLNLKKDCKSFCKNFLLSKKFLQKISK